MCRTFSFIKDFNYWKENKAHFFSTTQSHFTLINQKIFSETSIYITNIKIKREWDSTYSSAKMMTQFYLISYNLQMMNRIRCFHVTSESKLLRRQELLTSQGIRMCWWPLKTGATATFTSCLHRPTLSQTAFPSTTLFVSGTRDVRPREVNTGLILQC